jgi:hypothetical protein
MEILSPKRFSQLSSEEQKNSTSPPPATAPKQTGKRETAKALENAVGPKYVELLLITKIMTRSITLQGLIQTSIPGGISEFYKFVAKNFKISEEASKMKLKEKYT